MITTEDRPKTVVTGDMPVLDSRVMDIRAEALAAITESMVNLYTDKHLAVIREYATNARDAMVAAGKADQPIVVTLPDAYDPQLVVTDTGIGMTMDEVLDFYAQYGASDKRDTNTQVGSFGYGCKSAFTIADHFTVTADQAGVRTVAVLYRNDQGLGTVDVVYHGQTDAPNGVSVAVPISDHAQMEETARRFFATWQPDTVLVDGEQPHSVLTGALRIGPVSYVRHCSPAVKRQQAPYVLMGGVAYPMSTNYNQPGYEWARYINQGDIYLDVEIGAVDIVPSREGLRDTQRTTQRLRDELQAFRRRLVEHVREQVEQAPSWFGAARVFADWRPLLAFAKYPTLTWHDRPIGLYVKINQPTLYEFRVSSRRGSVKRVQRTTEIVVNIERLPKILLLTRMPDENATIRHLARYCADQQIDLIIPTSKTQMQVEWFDSTSYPNIVQVDYPQWAMEREAEHKAALAARRAQAQADGAPVSRKVIYDTWTAQGYQQWSVKQLRDFPGEVYYAPYQRYSGHGWLYPQDDRWVLVSLRSGQQADALRKRVPTVRSWRELTEKLITEKLARYSADQVRVLAHARAYEQNQSDKLAAVLRKRSSALHDPELRRSLRACKPVAAEARQLYAELQQWIGVDESSAAFASFIARLDKISFGSPLTERYPLLDAVGYWQYEDLADQLVHYLNGVYAAEQATTAADVA